MKNDLFNRLNQTATEFFGKDSLKLKTIQNKDGSYLVTASIDGIPEILEATDCDKGEAEYKALDALNYVTTLHLENDMFPTRPIEEYQPINLTISDLLKDGGTLQSFLDNYIDKYDGNPRILLRNTGTEYECIIESQEGNIHVRKTAKDKMDAIDGAARLAISVMYPLKLTVKDVATKID